MRFRLTTVALLATGVLGLSGCALTGGGSDDSAKASPPSTSRIRSCLKDQGVTVRTDFKVPGKGMTQRGVFQPETAKYSGSAYWRNGHVVDMWTARNEDDASSAESDLENTLSRFGKGSGSDQVVKRGLVIYAVDDIDPPTAREKAALDSCLKS